MLPYNLDRVRAAPGMYVPFPEFDLVASLVIGLDLATNSSFLKGFKEWLVLKVGYGQNLGWTELVLSIAYPRAAQPRDLLTTPDAHAHACRTLFDSLEGFLAEVNRPDGMIELFLRYDKWLRSNRPVRGNHAGNKG